MTRKKRTQHELNRLTLATLAWCNQLLTQSQRGGERANNASPSDK